MKKFILALVLGMFFAGQAMAKDPLVGEYEYNPDEDGSYVVIHEPEKGVYLIDINASFMEGRRLCLFEGIMKYNKGKQYYEIIERGGDDSYRISLTETGNKSIKLDYLTDNIRDFCGEGASFDGNILKKIK